jgi:hypothetical protein
MNHCDRHITLFSDTDIQCISIYLFDTFLLSDMEIFFYRKQSFSKFGDEVQPCFFDVFFPPDKVINLDHQSAYDIGKRTMI